MIRDSEIELKLEWIKSSGKTIEAHNFFSSEVK